MAENALKFRDRVNCNETDISLEYPMMYTPGFSEELVGTTTSNELGLACTGVTLETFVIPTNATSSGEENNAGDPFTASTPTEQVTIIKDASGTAEIAEMPLILYTRAKRESFES